MYLQQHNKLLGVRKENIFQFENTADRFHQIPCYLVCIMFYSYCTVLSIEKIAKNTDIKFPKKTDDNSQQLTTHFTLRSEALGKIAGN